MANLSDLFPAGSSSDLWDDASTSSVELLLNFNGTDGATSTTDESSSARTVTFAGDAQLDTALKKFGTASLLLDGAGDYISVPYVTADFNWWAADFTIDCWVYASSYADWSITTTGVIPLLIGNMQGAGVTNYWSFGPASDGSLALFWYAGNHIKSDAGVLTTGQWEHIALSHIVASNTICLIVNGEVVKTATSSTGTGSASYPLTIGSYNGNALTGQIDALRVTNGVARYNPSSATFTPPTSEPTAS